MRLDHLLSKEHLALFLSSDGGGGGVQGWLAPLVRGGGAAHGWNIDMRLMVPGAGVVLVQPACWWERAVGWRVVGRGTLLGPEGTGFGVWFARGAGLRSYRSRPVGWGVGVGVGCGVGVWSLLENCIVDASICSFCAASPAFLGLVVSSEVVGRGVLDGVVAMSS